MGWSIGFDSNWNRDIGYGVPAICDYPGCGEEIDRGLSHVCGGEPYGGERGCGLFFCANHLHYAARIGGRNGGPFCERCHPEKRKPFSPTPDVPEWIQHQLTDPSWKQWRKENPQLVCRMRDSLEKAKETSGV